MIWKTPSKFAISCSAHYLAGAISLGRAAELLELPALDLQARFQRLDVPLKLGPKDEQSALDEVNAARDF